MLGLLFWLHETRSLHTPARHSLFQHRIRCLCGACVGAYCVSCFKHKRRDGPIICYFVKKHAAKSMGQGYNARTLSKRPSMERSPLCVECVRRKRLWSYLLSNGQCLFDRRQANIPHRHRRPCHGERIRECRGNILGFHGRWRCTSWPSSARDPLDRINVSRQPFAGQSDHMHNDCRRFHHYRTFYCAFRHRRKRQHKHSRFEQPRTHSKDLAL